MSYPVKFSFGTEAQILSTPVTNGQIYYASDTNCIAYDLNGSRFFIDEDDILYDSTENWSYRTTFIPRRGQIIIYSDGYTDSEGNKVPGIKIGDGLAYGVDLPFITKRYDSMLVALNNHATNSGIHITQEEKEFLCNQAVTCSYSNETLTFTVFNQKRGDN